jgi:hypothetical protein
MYHRGIFTRSIIKINHTNDKDGGNRASDGTHHFI